MSEIAKRLKEVIKKQGVTSKELAEKMGMKPQTLSNALNRQEHYTTNFLLKVNNAIGGNLDYKYILEGTTEHSISKDDSEKDIIIKSLIAQIKQLQGKVRDIEFFMPNAA